MSRRARLLATATAIACAVAVGAAPHALAGRGPQNLTGGAPPTPAAADVEVEPQVAAVPADPKRVAVAWNQQLLDGGWDVVVALSGDGGRTWAQSVVPGLDQCAPPLGVATADVGLPSLSFGADGRLYLAALCYVPNTSVNEQLVVSLGPGSPSWTPPAHLGSGTRGRVVADPEVAGSAYVAYLSGAADTAHSVLVRHTVDGGLSWLGPTTAYASQGDDAYTADIAIVGHDPQSGLARLLVALHGGLDPNYCCTFTLAAWSDDGGASWSNPPERVPDDASDYPDVWPTDPEPSADPTEGTTPYGSLGPPIRAAAAADGTAFVVWSTLDADGTTRLLVSRHTEGGWSAPVAVNSTAGRAFEPQITTTSNGAVVVTYYDDRNDQLGSDSSWTVDVWQAVSRDGGRTWKDSHLAGPMDIRAAVHDRTFTDYFGVAPVGDDLFTAFVATAGLNGATGATEGQTDVYLTRTHP